MQGISTQPNRVWASLAAVLPIKLGLFRTVPLLPRATVTRVVQAGPYKGQNVLLKAYPGRCGVMAGQVDSLAANELAMHSNC